MSSDVAPRLLAVHAGRDDLTALGVHAPPLDLSSTNPLPDVDCGGASYEAMATGGHPTEGGNVYARLWNPTVARFETALAALEGTEEAVAFSSGMAAVTASVLAARVERGGSHVVAVRPLYGGTDHLLASGLLGVEVSFCAARDVASSVRPDTCLVVLETPANPTLELVDIAAVVEAARGAARAGRQHVRHAHPAEPRGTRRDAGPAQRDEVPRRPRRRGRRRGGSRPRLGVRPAPRAGGDRRDPAPHGGLPAAPRPAHAPDPGAGAAGVRREDGSLARRAPRRAPGVLPRRARGRSRGARGTADARTRRGAGDPAGWGYEQAARAAGQVRLFTHAVSLGGVDSLVQHPAALTHRPVEPAARPSADILRLSIGLEDVADLQQDLAQALG